MSAEPPRSHVVDSVVSGRDRLPDAVVDLIPAYLGRQRWYGGSHHPDPTDVRVVDGCELLAVGEGRHRLSWAMVDAEGARYQLLIGQRPGGEQADFLKGHDAAMLGATDSSYFYDATVDPELALAVLGVVSGGAEQAERVRPITAEQTNTSLVYDDRIIVKLYRRLLEGPNPDVEVTTALSGGGFDHVAEPIARWHTGDIDLAFAQRYLVGGSEGWAMALTSLRDLYNSDDRDPAQAGGDFAAEAARLGQVTAGMHVALAESFGVQRAATGAAAWAGLLDEIDARLGSLAGDLSPELLGAGRRVVAGLRSLPDPGPAVRVHGDFHLGQVMRTDGGWFVLDFEGEPARTLPERIRPSSPLKDVGSMVRSFHYAARVALGERAAQEHDELEPVAEAWERHNREAFIAGYRSTPGISPLVPSDPDWALVLAAFELDKALYELDYERAYRPDWVTIPLAALRRMATGVAPR
jgi:maltokinase